MDNKKLYVGNIAYEASSKDLMEFFSKYGEVIEAMIIPSKHPLHKSKGFGFITFAKEEEAEDALSLNGKEFKGRKLVVAKARQSGGTIYESRNGRSS